MRYLISVLAVLFWFNSANAETTCTYNDLGDQTCVTVTTTTVPGVTTDNLLSNDFTDGTWTGNVEHNHGVNTLAGHDGDIVSSTISLNTDAGLTKPEINSGFESTLSADVWFWNSYNQNVVIKQIITDDNGNTTTQSRTIDLINNGYQNYSDTYIQTQNSQQDYEITSQFEFNVPNTTGHYGADIRNPSLIIETNSSTSTSQSSTFTPCFELNTCTYDNEAVDDAVNLTGDDGKPIGEFIEDRVENIKPEDFNTEEFKVETFVMVPTDFKEEEFEEVKLEEFVKVEFEKFVSENNLQDTFETALVEEDITREEFYDAMSDTLKEEAFDDITPQSQTEEIKEEKTELTEQDELKEGDVNATSRDIRTTDKPTTTESEEVAQGDEEKTEAGPQDENVSAEQEVGNDKETERQAKTENTGENVETETDVAVTDRKVDTAEVSGLAEKVARVIKKLETKLKRVDDRLKATSYVLAVGLQSTQPDMTAYTNKRIYGNQNMVGIPNPDFFQDINILEQEQIYRNVSLSKYTDNDPITVRKNALIEIDMKKKQLMAEIAAIRSN